MQEVTIFRALGDPIRLEMVRRLATGETHTISSVSQKLQISRQGARKHLQILADAKLITLRVKGRNTQVLLLRDTLDQGKAFIEKLELQWDKNLLALKKLVETSS